VSDALSVLELLTVPPNVNCAPPVKVISAEIVVLPVYVWLPVVLTSAPRSDVPETATEVAPAVLSDCKISAFKSKLPVMMMAPTGVVPPTTPPNWTVAAELPPLFVVSTVKSWAPSIVLAKVTASPVVVNVLAAPDNVTAPV